MKAPDMKGDTAMAIIDRSNLSEEELEKVNGGYIVIIKSNLHQNYCAVVDDYNGSVLARFETIEEAKDKAAELGVSTERIKLGEWLDLLPKDNDIL